ncbi:MAG TPA: cytochrome c-type biogenesis protein, partial [Rhodanobacteraceae bacterium]|nr:cytochrome c-type biogenesis protein [Rhodanobacteraceae bacterium]
QMQAGKSDAEIKTWLTARYSDFVLYDPPLHGGTLLLWFGPALVLLAGSVAIFLIVRRRAAAAPVQSAPARSNAAEDDW